MGLHRIIGGDRRLCYRESIKKGRNLGAECGGHDDAMPLAVGVTAIERGVAKKTVTTRARGQG